MEELREVLTTAELPLYFQIDQEATSSELDFHDFESLISAAKNVQPRREDSRQTELTAGFLLHAPLMKALEIMGLVTETVGDDFIASPLQCTPEGEADQSNAVALHFRSSGWDTVERYLSPCEISVALSPQIRAQGPRTPYQSTEQAACA